MKNEENVYEETTQDTGAIAGANTEVETEQKKDCPKEALTVLGKFKDVDALSRAYEALEAEFTRRSQRLKELERQTENSAKEGNAFGAEKLRKNAENRKKKEQKFDEFVADTLAGKDKPKTLEEQAEPEKDGFAQDTGLALQAQDGVGAWNEFQKKGETDEATVKNSGSVNTEQEKGKLSSEEIYSRANNDEQVRLRIIGEYLSSLGKKGAPITTGKSGVFVSPPVKARNINEAGDMALRYFKKEKTQGE